MNELSTKLFLVLPLFGLTALACDQPAPEPTPDRPAQSSAPAAPTQPAVKPWAPPTSADPAGGKFSLDDATKDLAGSGDLVAKIETDQGDVTCSLYADKAPITVANFVGLARGVRPYWDGSDWVKKPAYEGTLFHRIVKGFMIQGGSMNGGEETGYTIPDEIWPGAKHDRAGLLCMANRGANTGSKQFFITDDAAPHLDKGGYTIFGECTPVDTIHTLASSPVRGDRAIKPPVIKKITISRGDGAAPAGSASAAASASAAPAASAAPSASASAKPAPSAKAAPAPSAGSPKKN